MKAGQEIWEVKISSLEPENWNHHQKYLVFAISPSTAEKAGLAIARKDGFPEPVCRLAEFHGYVY